MNTDQLYPEVKVGRLRREQVLLGIWDGKGTKEIAAGLGISPKTVEYHREQLYRVFGVRNPVSLCRRAMELGLIEAPWPKVGRPSRRDTKGFKHGTPSRSDLTR